ncbi:hypothetical protein HMPREF1548_06127 [Clostridium sp. KLE 1755]|nr:hypothetical protein HMPREF1548_06127 [Clostridium sp. KLE 1755]
MPDIAKRAGSSSGSFVHGARIYIPFGICYNHSKEKCGARIHAYGE